MSLGDYLFDEYGEPRWGRVVPIVGVLILAISLIFGSFYVVGAGERAVEFNAISGMDDEVYGEGIHLKMPFLTKAIKYEVRDQLYEKEEDAASEDLQMVATTVAVRYYPEEAFLPEIHTKFGTAYAHRVVKPAIQEAVKASTANYTAEELVTKRPELKAQITSYLKERLADSNIVVVNVDITNFRYSDAFNEAIELKVTAEQEALREKNQLLQEKYKAERKVVNAEADAKAHRERANATAEARLIEAQAEAEAIRLLQEQIAQNPLYIDYIRATGWDGRLPQTVAGEGVSVWVK